MSYLDNGGKVIDTMLGLPDKKSLYAAYETMKAGYRDRESRDFAFPAQYMFNAIPDIGEIKDPIGFAVEQMDKYNIERGLVSITFTPDEIRARFPDRFSFEVPVDPGFGMEEVRRIRRLVKSYDVRALSFFASGSYPQVAINSKEMYVIYAACVDLDLPILLNAGVPGPRYPMAPQKTELIDEVCWYFPDLKVVMRHGAEPWEDLAVKLMLKYPNLYYSTSAFAPKHYPKAIIDYANTRGADKVIFAGYWPMGLSLERIYAELRQLPFRDHVWEKFLYGNAKKLFKL
ncbi:amidohydrolase family protein [Sphingomonas sp.]|uniref:amidohydrolase family protein n=1 Tax=Sphingomonas sp. TaxID=28214 RepID=UPI003B0017E9